MRRIRHTDLQQHHLSVPLRPAACDGRTAGKLDRLGRAQSDRPFPPPLRAAGGVARPPRRAALRRGADRLPALGQRRFRRVQRGFDGTGRIRRDDSGPRRRKRRRGGVLQIFERKLSGRSGFLAALRHFPQRLRLLHGGGFHRRRRGDGRPGIGNGPCRGGGRAVGRLPVARTRRA